MLLAPAELLYRAINRLRRALYRAGVLKAKRLPRPVISVGNIAIGGSGKTPAVIAVARLLSERGRRVAILTRGYGRSGAVEGIVTSDDAARWGDEPVVIKKHLPNVDVIVGSNRYNNGLHHQCDVFVLDDGFQHLQVARDLDIVIDAPSRWFREGRSALRDADIVIPRAIRPARLDQLRGRRVYAFSGLADNDQFFDMLRGNGVYVVATRSFADHHRYSGEDIAAIKAAAAGADAIVTTEKDAVKIGDPAITAVPIEFELPQPVIDRILEIVSR